MKYIMKAHYDGLNIKYQEVIDVDEVVERNRDLLLKRSQVGLIKYGCGLDNSGLGLKQFLIHALEETLDKANYLQAAIMEIERQEKANEQI